MQLQSICFGALIPSSGFRWIYKDDEGKWHLRQPPEDWPERDYAAAGYHEDRPPKPHLSDRFYLVASIDECIHTHAEQQTEFGNLVCEPELYIRFASARATPSTILDFANQYGLLHYNDSTFRIRRADAKAILTGFNWDMTGPDSDDLLFRGEMAANWLSAFESVRFNLRVWEKLQSDDNIVHMSSYLNDGYNYAMSGSLTYQVKMDPKSGEVHSEVIASSVAHLLEVQWGMSVAANMVHRQCSECPAWFSVHPGSGRPEKQFCSDACRMRAYRMRKASKQR